MKTKTQFVLYALVLFCLPLLTGCSKAGSYEMANELRFSLDQISDLTISYDEEELTFFASDDDTLVIKEYMTVNKSSYYAKVKQKSNSIHISEGGKPIFKDSFSRRIEIYLPSSYKDNLTVTTTDGDINMSNMNLHVSALRIDSTSGTVQVSSAEAEAIHLSSTSGTLGLGNIKAGTIRLETTSGNVTCEKVDGNVTYTSTSGNAEFQSAVGSGSYKANNSGKLSVVYAEVNDDLSLFNKNDNIRLDLPDGLEFEFEAITKNGSISTTFPEQVNINGDKTSGTVGNNPAVTIKVETKNGNIEVMQ